MVPDVLDGLDRSRRAGTLAAGLALRAAASYYRPLGQRACSGLSLVPILFMAVATQASAATSTRANLPATAPASSADVTPHITVIAQLAPRSYAELALEAQDRAQRRAADRETAHTDHWLVGIGVVQILVFLGQLLVFSDQARKLRKTVVAAERQSADMRESIGQSARSATALEALGTSMAKSAAAAAESVATVKERTALQLRAYLSVVIGGALYQESQKPAARFEPLAMPGADFVSSNGVGA